jgi:uncharacterized Zn-binding protein involved in type VI secretion
VPAQARVSDIARCPSCSHGCLSCSHDVQGPCTAGSDNVRVNGFPAARETDPGVHSSCCDANTWIAKGASTTVIINGLGAHRVDDETTHCGGVGTMTTGSPNVIVGG